MSKPGSANGKRSIIPNQKSSKTSSSLTSSPSVGFEPHIIKFVFEGERFHARTPICFDTLNLEELLQKKDLDMTLPAPTARQLFETSFKEDIFPFVRHNIQSQIQNKRDILKLWDIQSSTLQKIYEDRATLLRAEWQRRRQKQKQSKQSAGSTDQKSLRRKAELKAKNKANKQKWKDEIAMRIASGQFDELEPSHKKQSSHHKKKQPKKLNQKKKNMKKTQLKASKKKKLKKWKDKRPKNAVEWPVMSSSDKNTNHNSPIVSISGVTPTKTPQKIVSALPALKPTTLTLPVLENEVKSNGFHKRKLIYSEVRFRFLLRSENAEYLMNDEMARKQLQSLTRYIDKGGSDGVLIKIWIHVDHIRSIYHQEHVCLNTDKDHVLLTANQSKVFEILWSNFGVAIKERIDLVNMDVAFVKKSQTLRLEIPILSK